jgi:hypothetical protein
MREREEATGGRIVDRSRFDIERYPDRGVGDQYRRYVRRWTTRVYYNHNHNRTTNIFLLNRDEDGSNSGRTLA